MGKDKSTSVYFDRKKLEFVGLSPACIIQLKEAYKKVDVDIELQKMSIWLQSPKGRKRRGNLGFINKWLTNADSTAILRPKTLKLSLTEDSPPLHPSIVEYLEEFWKGKEHILAINTITSQS